MGFESRRFAGTKSKKGSPPILSHEFIIQNHGDIMSCILMVVIIGFMFQMTSAVATIFVVPQYNETIPATPESEGVQLYRVGVRDIATIIFYTIAWITAHAVLQEYVLDKLQRRLHLSKTKTSKFYESGQLLVFSLYSACHAAYILHDLQIHRDITLLWAGYPHRWLTLHTKIFFLVQIAYWLHQFPEFYFQKLKRDEMYSRSVYSVIYLLFTISAYILNFNRLALAGLFLEFVSQTLFHASRMIHFAEKKNISGNAFKLWNFLFVSVRLGSAVLSVLTLWYGLRSNETPFMDPEKGNYNTSFIRLNCLLCVLALQLYQMWNFLLFHFRRHREKSVASGKAKQQAKHKAMMQQRKQKKLHEEIEHLPEADQQATRAQQGHKKHQ